MYIPSFKRKAKRAAYCRFQMFLFVAFETKEAGRQGIPRDDVIAALTSNKAFLPSILARADPSKPVLSIRAAVKGEH